MSRTSKIEWVNYGPDYIRPFGALPKDIAEQVARFVEVQEKLQPATGNYYDTTRRYEIDEGELLYFPEIGLPTTLLGALSAILFIGGLVLIIAGLSIASDGHIVGRNVAVGGGATLIVSFFVFGRYNRRSADRQASVESLGLYLLPDCILINKTDGVRVFPRDVVVRFCSVRLPHADNQISYAVVEYKGEDGELYHSLLEKGGHGDMLALCNAWLEGSYESAAA